MNKPTLFFSHSSKDKDMVLAIKSKVMQYTSGTLEIFQSSDGESIPFGTNWIHKVEEGLKEAKVMFVFVTEKSVASGWIYFEAGYAYSKGVHVIPVGIGINVGDLKAPLNLLQGFNITSADSLNNFLHIGMAEQHRPAISRRRKSVGSLGKPDMRVRTQKTMSNIMFYPL